MQFAQRSFVTTLTITADSPPTPVLVPDAAGKAGSFRIAVYNQGSHGASIVFADDASAHSGYFFGNGVSAETDGWTAGDLAGGLYLYASSPTVCEVTIRWAV